METQSSTKTYGGVCWFAASLLGAIAVHGDELPRLTTLSDTSIRYHVPDKPYVVLKRGDVEAAQAAFEQFNAEHPHYPGAFVNLAIIHASRENDAASRDALDAALALDPDHPAALNQLGMLLRRNGNFLEAEAAYMKAVTVSPDYALAHYNLGVLNELYLQRLESALQHFEIYQSLVGEDKQVEKWITDLTRRVAANQRTANVAE
jgi:tetratricopeptide (TPR) repeat protein